LRCYCCCGVKIFCSQPIGFALPSDPGAPAASGRGRGIGTALVNIAKVRGRWRGSGTGPARVALAALDSRLGGGIVKLVLEVALKAAGPARRGEVARYFIRHGAACAS